MATLSIRKNTWEFDSCEIDLEHKIEEIKELLTIYIHDLKREKAPIDILKCVLKKYFNASKISTYTHNQIFLDLIDFIRKNKAQKKFALVCLDANSEKIVLKTKYMIFPEDEITIESLKEQIKSYIKLNPKEVHISNIIFNSLEQLSGYKANRHVTRYYNNGICDKCIENPLYKILVEFVQGLPEYNTNLGIVKKNSSLMQKKEKIARKLQKETTFIDRKYEYFETHVNKHFAYNTRFKNSARS